MTDQSLSKLSPADQAKVNEEIISAVEQRLPADSSDELGPSGMDPLPQCPHNRPLLDCSGEILEPRCGCRWGGPRFSQRVHMEAVYVRRLVALARELILDRELSKLDPADAAKIKRGRELSARSSATMTGSELREARENAGLSLGQAAKLLGIVRGDLVKLESSVGLDWIRLNQNVEFVFNRVYGLGGKTK